jgi:serine/threonine-protein kinase RsbW
MSADSSIRQRILARVDRNHFVGRAAELRQIVSHPQRRDATGLLVLLAPAAGVSELLRQAYDELFHEHGNIIPIYFALPRDETTAVSAAIEFLNAFLSQYLAFRRHEPALCHTSLTLNELLALAQPADFEWIETLVEAYNRERFSNDDRALVRWCLSAPQKVPSRHGRAFVMLDAASLVEQESNGPALGPEMIRVFSRANLPYAIAGLRRQILGAAHTNHGDFDDLKIIRPDRLTDEEGRNLVEQVAQRRQVELSEETRDLLVQQFECSPFFITEFIEAAREKNVSLTSYLVCEQLYVDELMGGRISRYCSSLLEKIAPKPETRRALIRLLNESSVSDSRKSSFEIWRKNLRLEAEELEPILRGLHVQELITWDGTVIEAGGGPVVWKDYLKTRQRLEIAAEPRALVVAETIAESLKRSPHTMARHYRRVAAIGLRDLLASFDRQGVPSILFDYSRFSEAYKGATEEVMIAGLETDTDLVQLPQVVHPATCASYNPDMLELCEEERCVAAHAFEKGNYTDDSEVVWLASEIDAKLEADRDLAEAWCERLDTLARQSGMGRIRIWLIAKEGFSQEASEFLAGKDAFGSSRQQLDLLVSRIHESVSKKETKPANEYEMTVPMGGDNELIVAHTVEQIARRLNFQPEAINQIKHAVVEACINASEHSLSPEQKIYQRFRVEDDKLVITIWSRGIVPEVIGTQKGEGFAVRRQGSPANRRGLGIKMIKALMDEVEFERVDDGTSLRMTKYLRN